MNPLMQSIGNAAPAVNHGTMANLSNIVRLMRNGNPEQIARNMMQQNPQFRAFVQANQGKTPEQIAKENGIDLGQIMEQIR